MPILTKPCKCVSCSQPMAIGEEFAWNVGKRPVVTGGRSRTGAPASREIGYAPKYQPKHAHDCLTPIRLANAAAHVREMLQSAAELELSAEQRERLLDAIIKPLWLFDGEAEKVREMVAA